MAGGSQIPLWITITLGVLAVVGTIGGAWGGQLIAGRNDSRRWRRERDREAQAYWRDRRLAAYSSLIAHYEGIMDEALGFVAFYDPDESPSSFPLAEMNEIVDAAANDVETVHLIGSESTVKLCKDTHRLVRRLVWSIGDNHPSMGDMEQRKKRLHEQFDEARKLVDSLRLQFRKDLGVTMSADSRS